MKVSKEAFAIAERILSTFDAEALKERQVAGIERRQKELEAKLADMAKPLPDHHL